MKDEVVTITSEEFRNNASHYINLGKTIEVVSGKGAVLTIIAPLKTAGHCETCSCEV